MAGPTLGISREYDGQGHMPLRGLNKIVEGGVNRNTWFMGDCIVKFTTRPEILTR